MTLGIGELLLPLDIILNRPDEICFGTRNGTLDAQAFGGTAPYKYYWSNGMTGSTINKLPAGTYTVTVIDSKSCFQINQVTVSEGKPMTIQVGHTLPSCHNGSDAKAWVEKVSVDTTVLDQSQITYQWSILNQITPVVSSLRAGTTYYVTVTNSKGCSSTASLTIGNPLPLKAEIITAINPKCTNGNSGTLSAATTGGLPPYSYNWGANTNYQEGDMAKGLAAGSYAVTVTDSLTCTTVASGKLTDPPPIKTYLEKTAVRCFGGSDGASTAVAEGGISPYRYIWSNGIMGNKLTNVVSADYQVTVTDAAGCTHISQVFIPQPEPLALATAFASPATCFGLKNGRIQAEGKGGIPPYSFSLEGKNFSSSSIFISLGAGTYKVFMRDKNSCDYISPEVQVAEPQLFTVDIGQDTLVAPGNSIRIVPEISGRDSNSVSFFWQSTNPLSRIADPTWKNAEFHLMGSTIASLEASDSNGCKATDQKYIQVYEFRSIQVPTAFAPGIGGNPVNDLLHVHGNTSLVEKINLFRIFNRWGEVIYETSGFKINDLNVGWDGTFKGKEVPAGVYLWYVEVKFIDGSVESYKGHTTLVR
jgi:gliding motility-associated-like protein